MKRYLAAPGTARAAFACSSERKGAHRVARPALCMNSLLVHFIAPSTSSTSANFASSADASASDVSLIQHAVRERRRVQDPQQHALQRVAVVLRFPANGVV